MPKCQLTLLHTCVRAATCFAAMTISGCMASVVIVSPTTSSPTSTAIYNPVPINLQLTDFCGPLNVQLDGNTVLPAGNWQQITAQSGTQSFTGLLPALTLATPHTLMASEGSPQSGNPPQACPPPNSGGQGLTTISSNSVTFTVTRKPGTFSSSDCKLSARYISAGDLIYTPDGYFGTSLAQIGGTGVLEVELGNLPLGGSIRFTPGYVQVLSPADALLIDSEASGSSPRTWTFFDFLSEISAYTNPKLIVPILLSNPGGTAMDAPELLCSPDGTVVMVVDVSQTQVGTGPHAPWNLQHSTVIDLMSATFMTCGYQDGGALGAQILPSGALQVYSGFLGSGTMFSSCSQ
jgi:hypothetical protein